MSRSGYIEDCENLELYRQAVKNAIKGKRGQEFLLEMAAAMDSMPEKILIADELVDAEGSVCAVGVVCKARGLDTSKIDYKDPDSVSQAVGIARSMAAEIEFENDQDFYRNYDETPTQRWERMRKWVSENLK